MQHEIRQILMTSAAIKQKMADDPEMLKRITTAAEKILAVVRKGGTIFICGNGGSASDAMHFYEELVGRYKGERRGTKAMHFMDPAYLTCWANDYDFETVFSRQVETFCTAQDLLVLISTSGNSKNIIKAYEAAQRKSCPTLTLTGKDGGKMANLSSDCIVIPTTQTERVQEAHITLIHIFCEMIEQSGVLK